MEQLQRSGKARSIGVSNFSPAHLETLAKTQTVVPAINQIEYHLYLQSPELLEYSRSKGIATAAYAAQTPITKAAPGPADERLAKKYFVGEGEICLRWCLDDDVVAVTTSAKEQRLSDYLRVLAFKLTPREQEELTEAGKQKHFRGFWTTKYPK